MPHGITSCFESYKKKKKNTAVLWDGINSQMSNKIRVCVLDKNW